MSETPQSPSTARAGAAASTSTPQAGIADAFGQLSEQTAALVRQEIDSARREITEKAIALAASGAMLGGAAVLGVFAAASAHRWLVKLLEKGMSPAMAAFTATLLYGGGAGALAAVGARALKEAAPPYPAQTIDRVSAEAREVADRVSE